MNLSIVVQLFAKIAKINKNQQPHNKKIPLQFS